MSREIKFRAVINGHIDKNKGWLGDCYSDKEGVITLPDDGDDVIYLQFTGLKDKNGTEIYEGDIVEYWVEQQIINNQLVDKKQSYKEVVMFANGSFCFSREDEIVFGAWLWEASPKVIGNIYQNPELLKE